MAWLIVACCMLAVLSTTIAVEAKWDWWWELPWGFLPFLWSHLFLEEEGPALLVADSESAPFCLKKWGGLPFHFIADILSATWSDLGSSHCYGWIWPRWLFRSCQKTCLPLKCMSARSKQPHDPIHQESLNKIIPCLYAETGALFADRHSKWVWRCYNFRRLRQSSTVVVSKVRNQMSLEDCKSWTCIILLGLRVKVQVKGLSIKD